MKQRKTLADPVLTVPEAVSDHALEVTRRAYMERDFEAFQQRFILPQTVGTFHGDQRLETREDLWLIFDKMCNLFDRKGIIDLQRQTIAARFLSSERVQATFISRYLRANLSFTDETLAHGTLRLVDGLWRIEESRYATDAQDLNNALSVRKKD